MAFHELAIAIDGSFYYRRCARSIPLRMVSPMINHTGTVHTTKNRTLLRRAAMRLVAVVVPARLLTQRWEVQRG